MEPVILLIVVLLAVALAIYIGVLIGRRIAEHQWRQKEKEIREDAVKRSRAVLAGQFSEQLAPYLPDFPYRPTEARFIGKPIDFIVFKGMDEKDIHEVIFVEVKSGNSRLSTHEKKLRDAIDNKRVAWHEYRIEQGITGRKDS